MAKPPSRRRQTKRRVKKRPTRQMSRLHWAFLFVSTSLFSIVFFLISDIAEATRGTSIYQDDMFGFSSSSLEMINMPLELPEYFQKTEPKRTIGKRIKAPKMKWKSITVEKGDSLSKLFLRMKLNPRELHKIIRMGKSTKTLNLISPGEELKFLVINDKLQELIYEVNDTNSLHITRSGDEFTASTITTELDKRIAHATATIGSSLFVAAQEAGIPGSMTMELANIFDWDIDFVLDVRTGDSFSIIYEEYYLDGEKVSYGDILAAEFSNNGKIYRAVRYRDTGGHTDYFTPEGDSVRKAFLRTPVDYTRISSTFGKRYHPVLNRMRNHQGVDYVAPRGTPIKASGDGYITHIGRKGGYGSTIIIQHGGKYSTLYAHLKGSKRGLRRGSKVRQGDIIGYVGSSGLATGPHLHYEFRVNGVHRNPLTVKLPGASPITRIEKLAFKLNTQGYLTMLNTLGNKKVATSKSGSGGSS
jgi:murein DD-endopeptidase MepM/ murein hydrolase activator NlpD